MSIGRRVGEGHGHCQARRAVDAVEVPQGHAADGAAVEIYGVLIGVCVVAAIGDVEDLIAGGGQAKAMRYSPGSMFPKTWPYRFQLPSTYFQTSVETEWMGSSTV